MSERNMPVARHDTKHSVQVPVEQQADGEHTHALQDTGQRTWERECTTPW